MMISPTADPYAAAAALDRLWRSPGPPDDASSDGGTPDGGPDVVVMLSRAASGPPSTYDASGKLPGAPTLEDRGVTAQATEPQDVGEEDGPDADSTAAATNPARADVDKDAADAM